jgi:Cellulose biosynthesis protein BcsS
VIRLLVTTFVVLAFWCPPAKAQASPDLTGVEEGGAKKWLSHYTEAGFILNSFSISHTVQISPQGDLDKTGFLFEFLGGSGSDSYLKDGTTIDVTPWEAQVFIGYRWIVEKKYTFDLFGGWDYLDYALSHPDPTNEVRGARNGFKIESELEAADERKLYYDFYGEYSTNFNTYDGHVRLGPRFNKVVVGAEVSFLGDISFASQRVGGFTKFPIKFSKNFEPNFIVVTGFSWLDSSSSGSKGGGSPGPSSTFAPGAGSGNGVYTVVGMGFSF